MACSATCEDDEASHTIAMSKPFMYICRLTIKTMTNINRAIVAVLMTASMAAIFGCQKPDNSTENVTPVENTNYFTYDGYPFEINSVVQYDKGDNNVELWLSPTSGLTTTSEIAGAGDYVVLNTHRSYLGNKDRFNGQSSKSSFIRFCENLQFAYGKTGTAYIEVSINGSEISISFLAQHLYSKAADAPAAMLEGKYSGSFTVEKELPYSNQWGMNRNREDITAARYTTYEDGSNSSVALFTEPEFAAIELILEPAKIGKTITLTGTAPAGVELKYSNGVDFDLKGTSGTISTTFTENTLKVSMNIIKDELQLRVEYDGAYEAATVKLNRYDYDYSGTSAYTGVHQIAKLMVATNGLNTTFYFAPSEGYQIATSNYTHMPILKVPTSIINAGKKSFMDIKDWEFAYDMMQVWPYEDEYRPHPADTDWIEIKHNNNVYEIEFVLSSQATGMPECHIDVYYNGPAK